VVLVAGETAERGALTEEDRRILEVLLQELTVKKAAVLAASMTGKRKKDFYNEAVRMKSRTRPEDS
jgi:16S rRNA (cytidine1402-2'-O)-methyltransferase